MTMADVTLAARRGAHLVLKGVLPRPARRQLRTLLGWREEPWCRVVMNAKILEFVSSLPAAELDVVEISGTRWGKPEYGFRSYLRLEYPDYDVCTEPYGHDMCDLVFAEQVFEHVEDPERATANVLAMLRPGGTFVISTPFILKFHPIPRDFSRWTEEGMRAMLARAGFTDIETSSWGNRKCIAADMYPGMNWRSYNAYLHSLKNEAQFPVMIWAFARKPREDGAGEAGPAAASPGA